jgi:hypothetical protein
VLFLCRLMLPMVSIPKALANMNALPAQSKDTWTPEEVVDLYKKHHLLVATKTAAVFYVYFVNGYSSSGSSTIAFSINTTPVVAVFKDVIRNSGGVVVQKFVEQSTMVHELGHAFGLVNNGIPLTSDHQDVEHGAHTINSDCVMYWLNEGSADLQAFVANYIITGDTVMWGPEVLADAEAFSD